MSDLAKMHFVEQQGLGRVEGEGLGRLYSALMFQPRIVGVLTVIGLVAQSGVYFLALSALLWWNVLMPAANPFGALYNALVARPRGGPLLGPAPAPRRFAQGMAAAFMLGIGISLLGGQTTLAWVIEGFLVVALAALLAGRVCLGSYIYHLLAGNARFANRTLPWGRA